MLACALIFVAQWPRLSRAAFLDPSIELNARLAGALGVAAGGWLDPTLGRVMLEGGGALSREDHSPESTSRRWLTGVNRPESPSHGSEPSRARGSGTLMVGSGAFEMLRRARAISLALSNRSSRSWARACSKKASTSGGRPGTRVEGGGGLVVTAPDEAVVASAADLYLAYRHATTAQLFETRRALELSAVELAVPRLDEGAIGRLRSRLEELEESLTDLETGRQPTRTGKKKAQKKTTQ